MNKSLGTNLVALLVIIGGYFSPWFSLQILSIGFFALSGAITNWLAIHMLFEKVPLLYGSGVVPLHFKEFKEGIRHLIMTEFFTKENLEKFFSESAGTMIPDINLDKAIESVDYNSIFDSLTTVIMESQFGSMLGMFGGASALDSFREPFILKIKKFVKNETESPDFKKAIASSIETGNLTDKVESQVEGIVNKRLDELTPVMVKIIIQDMIKKHLGWLVVWGGVFGGVIGLIMSFIKAF
ncbi:MAG: DUF445 domain-containing protein [Spirochaetes bacterium]|nr:MAG: DUF445 domain-containing protein [Spirochaetota bacterium]